MPATASLVQDALGANRAGAFDLNAVCSGFLYGLATGSQFILSGMHQSVLIVGAEVFTRILDWQDRSTCVLFGDAAGAVVLQPTNEPGGLLSFVLGSDGSRACSLYVPRRQPSAYVSRDRRRARALRQDAGPRGVSLRHDRRAGVGRQALDQAGLTHRDVDLFIPHQANVRIIDAAARRLKLADGAVFSNVEKYGNTSAASVPVALCEALEEGRVALATRS